MILSPDQLRRAIEVCPDCARREVEVTTYPSMLSLLTALFMPEDADLDERDADDEEVLNSALTAVFGDVPVNAVQVLHDPGCPRLESFTRKLDLGAPGEDSTELVIIPAEVDGDSEWVQRLGEP